MEFWVTENSGLSVFMFSAYYSFLEQTSHKNFFIKEIKVLYVKFSANIRHQKNIWCRARLFCFSPQKECINNLKRQEIHNLSVNRCQSLYLLYVYMIYKILFRTQKMESFPCILFNFWFFWMQKSRGLCFIFFYPLTSKG